MVRRQFIWCLTITTAMLVSSAHTGFAANPLKPSTGAKINWHKDLRSAHKVAVAENKPLLVVFGASWCGYCHKLERETLGDKAVAGLITKEFVPVHLDFDKDTKVAKILDVESLPCTVILTPDADLLVHNTGYSNVRQYTEVLDSALAKQAEIQQTKHAELP